MKRAIRIEQGLHAAYGLAAGFLLVYIARNAWLDGFGSWMDGAAAAAVAAMLAHRPVRDWAWAAMKRRIVRRMFGRSPPTPLPVWDRNTDYPADYVLACCGLLFESAAPTGPSHGNVASPLEDGQRVWTPV